MQQNSRALVPIAFLALDTDTTSLVCIMRPRVDVRALHLRLDSWDIPTFQGLAIPRFPCLRMFSRVTHTGSVPVHRIPRPPATCILAHQTLVDLGLLAIALTRSCITFPPHDVFDTLDMARRLNPSWPSHSVEHVATRLKVANRAEHRPLSDAAVCTIEPLVGFEALATAMTEQCAITIMYDRGSQRPRPRKIPPHLVLEVHGVAYVIAHCHLDTERTFRLDRVRGCWLA
jgi:hypothetical protein